MLVAQPALEAARQLGGWARGRRRRFRVSGPSMEPTLRHGQFVLVDPGRRPGVGELALARHPTEPGVLVVKRVAQIRDDGRYELASDNPAAGTDSRHWGPLGPDAIEGTVTLLLDDPFAPLGPRQPGPAPLPASSLARWLRR